MNKRTTIVHFKSSMEGLRCDICNKSFTGMECFKQHEASEKHKKKLRISNGTLQDATNTIEMKADALYHCSVCSISLSGMINYEKHVNSLSHANMIQMKNKVTTEYAEETNNTRIMQNSVISMNNSMNVIVPYAECKFCDKEFSGPEPYQQHLASAAHIKKSGMHSSFQVQKDDNFNIGDKEKLIDNKLLYDSEHAKSAGCSFNGAPSLFARQEICNTTGSSQTLLNYMCVVCDIQLTGPAPYEQHLQGKYHKKKIIERELAKSRGIDSPLPDSTLRNSLECNPGVGPRYYCDICKKQCSGPIPFNSHILSRDHGKNVRIAEMEANMKKIKESGLWPESRYIASNSFLNGGEISSTNGEISSTYEVDSMNIVRGIPQMNDLNSKSEFLMKSSDLIQGTALPNFNIITPENMDITIFGINDKIVFNDKKKERE
ncbi:zinc finger protein [Trichonephila inaurata madagascariensis]|uniref:Zinc finger protein n=1 Tax=Trichonephila inaurata madagascariensis TaxID=2747483 RepID=A0A8X7CPA8_9ARAC|nr:zinc finger protein [Trichonephila inaurata madagascariensis]